MKTRTLTRSLLLVALACACGWLAAEARAQAYKYKDAQGHVHFTENIYEVPERYRSKVETRDMPVHVDPNAPPAPEEGTVAASFEDGVRHGIGHDLTTKQEEAVRVWVKKWMVPFIATSVLNMLIGLGMVIHAFVQGKIGWGLANFFIGVSSPFYLMIHVETSAVVRFGLLGLYLSPMVVIFMAMSELSRAIS
jgi:hypothetical protein